MSRFHNARSGWSSRSPRTAFRALCIDVAKWLARPASDADGDVGIAFEFEQWVRGEHADDLELGPPLRKLAIEQGEERAGEPIGQRNRQAA